MRPHSNVNHYSGTKKEKKIKFSFEHILTVAKALVKKI